MPDQRVLLGTTDTVGSHRIPQQQAPAVPSQAGKQTAPTSVTITSAGQQPADIGLSDTVSASLSKGQLNIRHRAWP